MANSSFVVKNIIKNSGSQINYSFECSKEKDLKPWIVQSVVATASLNDVDTTTDVVVAYPTPSKNIAVVTLGGGNDGELHKLDVAVTMTTGEIIVLETYLEIKDLA